MNGWTRDTAARVLYERQDRSCIAPLEKLARASKSPLARMHALYALAGQSSLAEHILIGALTDLDDRVREHAVRLSERKPELREHLRKMASDPSARVRYRLAFALTNEATRFPDADYADPWIRAAILSSCSSSGAALRALDNRLPPEFAAALAEIIGAANAGDHPRELAGKLGENLFVAVGLAKGLERSGGSLGAAGAKLYQSAADCLADSAQPEGKRIQAAKLLGYAPAASPALSATLRKARSDKLRAAILDALARFRDVSVAQEILGAWTILNPPLRAQALSILLARPERAQALLEALRKSAVERQDLSSTHVRQLIEHKEGSVRRRALEVLGRSSPPTRHEAMDQFRAALALPGDARSGMRIYQERCLSCHRLGKHGYPVGPDLITVKTAGKEKLLESILDPNREVLPQYVAQAIETTQGDSLVGIIAHDNANAITLREAFGKETVIPRPAIQKITSQRQSIMPEGLAAGLTAQQMADLLELLANGDVF